MERDDMTEPLVSVVLVNYRGVDDTLAAIRGLRDLDWPTASIEIVAVDNASGDGSVERLHTEAPDVRVVAQEINGGFAQGCNAGVAAASGAYVALLNNDARPHRSWIRAAVNAMRLDGTIGCVASKVLTWDGTETDFVEAGCTFYGQAFKLHHDVPDGPRWNDEKDLLFATGAALVMPTVVYRQLGGFDERYFMFFEDVDLGWRTWLAGYRVRYIPSSIVYHRHHATMKRYGVWFEQYLLERNGLYTLFKNLDDDNLARILPAALLLSTRRGIERAAEDPASLDLQRSSEVDTFEYRPASKQALASMHAQDEFLTRLPELAITRGQLQSTRLRTDAEIFRLFREPTIPTHPSPRFAEAVEDLLQVFSIDEAFAERRKVLIFTGDRLGDRMAGPAIRAVQIARTLAREHQVVLTSPHPVDLVHPDFKIQSVDSDDLYELATWSEIIIFQGFMLNQYPRVAELRNKIIVADLYDPFHLEQLEARRGEPLGARVHEINLMVDVLNEQVRRGDFFMCASEKQRDFWLGQLSAVNRVNPLVYDDDESLRSLLAVVPFGVSDEPPVRTGAAIRGVVPGIGADDKVILWGGGIYNWFDPATLIRAVDKLRHRLPNVRLFFMGTRHPNPHVSEHRIAVEAVRLAEDLGLMDRFVFFNDDWVPYDQRQNFLLDADVGVSTHFLHIETAFSFRTRILDYMWAGLPVVNTEGDALSSIISERRIGLTVPPEDVAALEHALYTILTDDEFAADCRHNVALVADDMRWERSLRPLVDFCRHARRAPDAARMSLPEQYEGAGAAPETRPWRWGGVRQDLRIFRAVLRENGASGVVKQAAARVRRLSDR